MKYLNYLIIFCFLSLDFHQVSSATDDRGSSEQAKAMTKKAVAYLKSDGKEKAFADFSDASDKKFHDRDLYVMVYDLAGVNVAHGANPNSLAKIYLN